MIAKIEKAIEKSNVFQRDAMSKIRRRHSAGGMLRASMRRISDFDRRRNCARGEKPTKCTELVA